MISFIEQEYAPWVDVNQKQGQATVARIKLHFYPEFGHVLLQDITALALEKWRTNRFKNGIRATTINRDIATLKAAFSKAAEWNLISSNPLVNFKLSKVDPISKLRFLSKDEERRLRQTIDIREERLCAARERGNLWRESREKPHKPDLRSQAFADHMKPLILLSINTGLRKGELLSLTWEKVNFNIATLTVTAEASKSSKARHIPLNQEAISILRGWQEISTDSSIIFPGKDGKPLTDIKKAWAAILREAKIDDFRWHDLRHHFASRLVMAGVDLNTVRELLGHSDIKMTLRYAHLAPEHKADAVAKLLNPM